MFMFLSILVSHLFFFIYWVVSFLQEFRSTFRKQFPRIYISLFLCFNNEKLTKEIQIDHFITQRINPFIAKFDDVIDYLHEKRLLYAEGSIPVEDPELRERIGYLAETKKKYELYFKYNRGNSQTSHKIKELVGSGKFSKINSVVNQVKQKSISSELQIIGGASDGRRKSGFSQGHYLQENGIVFESPKSMSMQKQNRKSAKNELKKCVSLQKKEEQVENFNYAQEVGQSGDKQLKQRLRRPPHYSESTGNVGMYNLNKNSLLTDFNARKKQGDADSQRKAALENSHSEVYNDEEKVNDYDLAEDTVRDKNDEDDIENWNYIEQALIESKPKMKMYSVKERSKFSKQKNHVLQNMQSLKLENNIDLNGMKVDSLAKTFEKDKSSLNKNNYYKSPQEQDRHFIDLETPPILQEPSLHIDLAKVQKASQARQEKLQQPAAEMASYYSGDIPEQHNLRYQAAAAAASKRSKVKIDVNKSKSALSSKMKGAGVEGDSSSGIGLSVEEDSINDMSLQYNGATRREKAMLLKQKKEKNKRMMELNRQKIREGRGNKNEGDIFIESFKESIVPASSSKLRQKQSTQGQQQASLRQQQSNNKKSNNDHDSQEVSYLDVDVSFEP